MRDPNQVLMNPILGSLPSLLFIRVLTSQQAGPSVELAVIHAKAAYCK